MSIKGQSFANSPTGAHLATAVGAAGGLYAGAFTIAALMRISSTSAGLINGWSGGVGGTSRGGLLLSSGSLFGNGDFSSGFGGGALNDNAWRWFVYSKAAGSAHYRMHVADLATLTWSHGESSGAGNHADNGTSDTLTWGMNENYALGFATSDLAVGAAWGTQLSDAAIEAALTQAAIDLAAASPLVGMLFKAADFGSPYVDFTGGGADESNRVDLASSADPADFDFTLTPPAPHEGVAAFTLDLAPAATGARAARGAAAVGLTLSVVTSGARASRGAAAFDLRLALRGVGPSTSAGHPAKLSARARRAALVARGTAGRIKARGGYADA